MPIRLSRKPGSRPLPPGLLLAGLALALATRPSAADEAPERNGEQIYRQQCASCHGASGEGTAEHYPKALVGDRSVRQLARLIDLTMPEDDPEACAGPDAEKVAAYIHDAFYSAAAQARNKPARVELSRLTVRQYRNAVADLVGSFREPWRPDPARGLKAQYSKSRRTRRDDIVLERVDPTVAFDFGTASPDPEKIEPHEFSIRWEGSVIAPETAEYEFLIKTDHATRLWVNDLKNPLIDALVKSGDDTEYRGSIYLIGGRSYALRLEFSKAKQGVDDKKAKERPPQPARISLEWKLPNRAAEVVPERYLTPGRSPRVFVVDAPFPPDDRSVGYERGTSISRAWEQATTDAAIQAAAHVLANLRELSGVADDAADRAGDLKSFCRRFAERAFRRPLTEEETHIFVDRQFEGASDPELAVKRVVLLTLKSPRFLYREIGEGLDPYDVASRLSFTLWDSLPDRPLLEAAAAGTLTDRAEVLRQAERMAGDPRARSKVREFLLYWLRVEHVPDLAKDPSKFPEFSEPVISDLRTSLELFVDAVIDGESADFRELLLSDALYLNGRLAPLYGADLPPEAGFQKVTVDPGERAGVLSHPYLMASFAYSATSSPIHRGVFIARSVLGRSLRPPPEAVSPLAPDLHEGLTTRERVTLQTSPASCMTCHGMINPLGFALERYDAIGRFRTEEKAKPVDAAGSYLTRLGETAQFEGVRELATFLAGSDETHAAFVEQLFHALVKQPIRAFGPETPSRLHEAFVRQNFGIRKLMVEIAAASALPGREPNP